MKKVSLRQLAYEKILESITNGKFPKGSVTSEGELGRMLDMSRTPIRSALQHLEVEGYVRIAPKHGVIILDSSSQRVGNLLDMLASMALFSYAASWVTNREHLLVNVSKKKDEYESLKQMEENAQSLIKFEFDLLKSLVSLSNNDEISRTFESASSRLFWFHNDRRWMDPFAIETMKNLDSLIDSLQKGLPSFTEALLLYVRNLKRTWL